MLFLNKSKLRKIYISIHETCRSEILKHELEFFISNKKKSVVIRFILRNVFWNVMSDLCSGKGKQIPLRNVLMRNNYSYSMI